MKKSSILCLSQLPVGITGVFWFLRKYGLPCEAVRLAMLKHNIILAEISQILTI